MEYYKKVKEGDNLRLKDVTTEDEKLISKCSMCGLRAVILYLMANGSAEGWLCRECMIYESTGKVLFLQLNDTK